MTVDELIEIAQGAYGSKNQLTTEQILANINYVQQYAFNRDLTAFVDYSMELALDPLSLIGPYPYPDPTAEGKYWGVRKVIGLSAADINVISNKFINRFDLVSSSNDDYGFTNDLNYVAGSIYSRLSIQDPIGRTIKFANEPSADADYKWVFFRTSLRINSSDSDDVKNSKLLIPEHWHYNVLALGTMALGERDTWGSAASYETLNSILNPFWEDMQNNYSANSGYVSEIN